MLENEPRTSFTVNYPSNDTGDMIVIEDDGRVAYAYLLDSTGQICADVWLYNRHPAPIEPEWSNSEKAPFLNPSSFVEPVSNLSLPTSADDIAVDWHYFEGKRMARIFIHKKLAAKIIRGEKPGWSVMAKKDGPLAKVLKI